MVSKLEAEDLTDTVGFEPPLDDELPLAIMDSLSQLRDGATHPMTAWPSSRQLHCSRRWATESQSWWKAFVVAQVRFANRPSSSSSRTPPRHRQWSRRRIWAEDRSRGRSGETSAMGGMFDVILAICSSWIYPWPISGIFFMGGVVVGGGSWQSDTHKPLAGLRISSLMCDGRCRPTMTGSVGWTQVLLCWPVLVLLT